MLLRLCARRSEIVCKYDASCWTQNKISEFSACVSRRFFWVESSEWPEVSRFNRIWSLDLWTWQRSLVNLDCQCRERQVPLTQKSKLNHKLMGYGHLETWIKVCLFGHHLRACILKKYAIQVSKFRSARTNRLWVCFLSFLSGVYSKMRLLSYLSFELPSFSCWTPKFLFKQVF